MGVKINYNGVDKSGKMAVVYARYSSHNQGEQSIDGQLAAARAYADARGYTIIHEYVDRAMTGRNDNRFEFQQMLSDCSKKQFQVIIVWKVDRFGRNREEITFNKYRAKKHGVRVEYVAENLPDSPEGVILESVLEGMAEYYSLQLSQNIRRGYYENAKKCKYAGGRVPLGYKLDKDRNFTVDNETAPIVRRIFKMYAEGNTTFEIIKELNDEGVKTSTGGVWTKNSLHSILKNEKYIGIFDFKNGEIRIENGVPAIVDTSVFNKVQDLLKVNKRAPAHKWSKADYLLTDKLFCGNCGCAMVGESGTSKNGSKYTYYSCVNHKRAHSCTRKSIRQDWIERFVLNHAIDLIMDDDMIDFITENTWTYYVEQDELRDKLKTLQKQMDDTDKAVTNIMKAIEAGLPMNETVAARVEELNAQKATLTAAIAGVHLEADRGLTKDHIKFFLKQFREMDFSDRNVQKRLIDVFVNSIYVTDDEITLNFNFSGNNAVLSFKDVKELRDGEVFVHRALCSTKTRRYEHLVIWYKGVFSITINR